MKTRSKQWGKIFTNDKQVYENTYNFSKNKALTSFRNESFGSKSAIFLAINRISLDNLLYLKRNNKLFAIYKFKSNLFQNHPFMTLHFSTFANT